MKQWTVTFAIVVAMGLAILPLLVYADQHGQAGAAEGEGTHLEGSSSHSHNGAKAAGKADTKKSSSPEEGSSSGHSHDSQAEKKEEGSH